MEPAASEQTRPHLRGMVSKSYCMGQSPSPGDSVRDENLRAGTVVYVLRFDDGRTELIIDWEDGTTDIRYSDLEKLALIECGTVAARQR